MSNYIYSIPKWQAKIKNPFNIRNSDTRGIWGRWRVKLARCPRTVLSIQSNALDEKSDYLA